MRTSTRTALVIVSALLTTQGVGAQERTYPGAQCVEAQDALPLDGRQQISRTSDGEIYNLSPTHTLNVVCPVSGLFDDTSGGSANVFVHDRNETQDVCCTTRLNNVGVILSSAEACSTGTDTRVQTLSMTPPELNFSFTSRYFTCSIPPTEKGDASGIRLYRY